MRDASGFNTVHSKLVPRTVTSLIGRHPDLPRSLFGTSNHSVLFAIAPVGCDPPSLRVPL